MSGAVWVHGAHQLLAATPDGNSGWRLELLHDAAVLVEGGILRRVGPSREVPPPPAGPGGTILDASGCLITAGFVDCHTHAIFAGDRAAEFQLRARGADYSEILAFGGGIHSTVAATRRASEDDLVRTAIPRLQTMLQHGTTTAEIKSGYGLSRLDELKMLRAIRRLKEDAAANGPLPDIIPTFLGAHVVPDEFKADRQGYLDLLLSMLPEVRRDGLAQFVDVFCDTGAFTPAETLQLLTAAKREGFGLKVHADELSHTGIVPEAARLGATSVDHVVHTSPVDIRALAQSSAVAVLLPNTTFSLMQAKYAPARAFLDAGVPVALATDFNPGTSFCPNLQQVLMLAVTQLKMTPIEALAGVTVNAARALGLADRGALYAGQRADLIIWDVPSIEYFGYYQGVNSVHTVIQNGRVAFASSSRNIS